MPGKAEQDSQLVAMPNLCPQILQLRLASASFFFISIVMDLGLWQKMQVKVVSGERATGDHGVSFSSTNRDPDETSGTG